MARRFRVHPAVGIARVGNAPDAFFVGPEHPSVPANWGQDRFESFRDDKGRIKRQAARFRLFEYVDDGTGRLVPSEVAIAGDIVDIEWRVHVANRKGSFFTFNGQSGAADVYTERARKPADAVEKEDPRRSNRRNASVPAARRSELEIDPGETLISRAVPGPVLLKSRNAKVPFISDLGELRLDDAGRLLVLGGHGVSGSTSTPPFEIDEYANNDTWFDDVSDGSVKARVHFADGSTADADAAWVMVGPPDFAPGVGNAVSLYDLMWDLAVREPLPFGPLFQQDELAALVEQRSAWIASGGTSLAGYTPSFTRDIYPMFARAMAAKSVHEPRAIDKGSYHVQLMDLDLLARQDGDARGIDPAAVREFVFGRIRNPDAKKIDWTGMPRGLGDDYDALDSRPPKPTGLFSLTRVQYALLEQWAHGHFVADWPGAEPAIPVPGAVSPAGLDRAAAENCVGGPFFPGIEVGWLIRRTELYLEPFRLRVPSAPDGQAGPPLEVGALPFIPGFFSQQMAQPWQADFYDCHKEEREAGDQQLYYYMWWTAQRPDDVLPAGSDVQVPWIQRLIPPGTDFDEFETSNERFTQMVKNWATLRFVVLANGRLEEEP